jgi:serine/threonine protein kinase
VYEHALDDAERDKYIGTLAAEKYVILAQISEGGMGTIYRALQLPVEREVALKVLRTELEDNDEVRKRFVREARAVSALSHPNIITLHDFGFDKQEHPYMVMEYAPGDTLDDWMHTDGLTLDRVLGVTRQILSALSDAHNEGIIHRDLKPENMIVTDAGAQQDFVKLLDFGIARLVNQEATQGLTREGEVFGTPHYMAPEQAQGETGIGAPADVYAMGIMLYEMLSGETPFDAPTPLAILFKQINEEIPPLEARPGWQLPGWVHDLVDKATHKAPEDRYQTAGEMFDALEAGLNQGNLPHATTATLTGGAQTGHNQAVDRSDNKGASSLELDTPDDAADAGASTNLQYGGSAQSESAPPHSPSQTTSSPTGRETPGEGVQVDDPDPTDSWFGETATALRPWYENDRVRRIAVFVILISFAAVLTVVAFMLTRGQWTGESAQAGSGPNLAGAGTDVGATAMTGGSADAGVPTDQRDAGRLAQTNADADSPSTEQTTTAVDDEPADEQSPGGRAGDDTDRAAGTASSDPKQGGASTDDDDSDHVEWTASGETDDSPAEPDPGAGDESAPQTGTATSDDPSGSEDGDKQQPDESDSQPERFGSPDDVPTKFGAPDQN